MGAQFFFVSLVFLDNFLFQTKEDNKCFIERVKIGKDLDEARQLSLNLIEIKIIGEFNSHRLQTSDYLLHLFNSFCYTFI